MTQDPAVLDRRTSPRIHVHERDLPVRSMTISGVQGRAEAKILSKDQSGPATRLVQLPMGWGTGLPGAFTADVEVFVIGGELTIGEETIGGYDYAAMEAGARLSGLRAESAVTALFMTSAPVRYDMSALGAVGQPTVARNTGLSWQAVEGFSDRFARRLSDGLHGEIVIAGAKAWTHDGDWHRHGASEEMFVLEGALTVVEWVEGEPAATSYEPGSYVHRPAGIWHGGPGSASSETAITVHRLPATEVTWTSEPG